MSNLDLLAQCTGFEGDKHNYEKIWTKHRVSLTECEQVFFNRPLTVAEDTKHSKGEKRFYALGQTDASRLLFMVFTIRKKLIRVISARDMNRKARKVYQSHEEENTEI